MKSLKRLLTYILVFVMIYSSLTGCSLKIKSASSNINMRKPVNVAVLLYNFNDLYMSTIKKTLEDIQIKNKDKVEFTFYDAKNNQAIQEATINNILQSSDVDILIVDLVNKGVESAKNVIDKAKPYNIPVVFTYVNPETVNIIKTYDKAVIVGKDGEESGEIQGKIITDIWNNNKAIIDKNNDNILQYIMLQGSKELSGKQRTLATLSAINKAGIQTEQLAVVNANWDKELAENAIDSLVLKYDGKIEAIISNNDAMAIGAIEALQKYGYNTGNPAKTVVVVGIDGMPQARELIDKEYMAGTVIQDPRDTAEVLYTAGMNLLHNKSPVEDTNYKLDNTGVIILLPYQEYVVKK